MRVAIAVLLVVFVLLVLWVALANASAPVVDLSLGFGKSREASLPQVILGGVLAGALFVGLLAVVEGLTLRVENLQLRKRVRRLEEEVYDLRNLALTGKPPERAPAPPAEDEPSGPVPLSDET
ncbi:MAG: LapA family protein [Acidobacteria bacterium]|nr:LapA family protein [Acidobacteriota bacterium]